MRGTTFAALAGLALVLAGTAASAQPASDGIGRRCFYITQFETWRAPDPHTMFIRVGINRFFRLDMASACPALTWPGAHLVTTWRGTSSVCSALDWDLKVSTDVNTLASPCIVKEMTELSPQEAAQIPPRYKP